MGQRSRVKRKAVQSDDGWTVITHGPTKVSLKEGEEKEIGSLPDAVNGLSTDLLAKDFQARQERWKDSGCMKQLDGILKNRKWDVVEAVCIGIGSFSRDWEHRHRALWQLVLFMHVVTILQEERGRMQIYAQDPAFTEMDKKFLEKLDVEVTTTLEKRITADSFVFSPFVDWYILLPVFLRDIDPKIYVGNEILDDYTAYAQSEDKRMKLEECNKLGSRFLEKVQLVNMVEFNLHAHALNGMVICWNKNIEEGTTSVEKPV